MQLVIADTGPINYLILTGHIDILSALFQSVILPTVVRDELSHPKAPPPVLHRFTNLPPWAEVHEPRSGNRSAVEGLDRGEEDAIALATELNADLILMDDREGVRVARNRGFRVAETLGILAMAAARGLLNLAAAYEGIKRTNCHYQRELMDQFLAEAARLIDQAAVIDRKDLDDNPRIDSYPNRGDRFRAIIQLLEKAKGDLNRAESNLSAIAKVKKAARDDWRDDFGGPPPQPHYLQAISDLRFAKALLWRRDFGNVMEDQREAIREAARAALGLRQAAIRDLQHARSLVSRAINDKRAGMWFDR